MFARPRTLAPVGKAVALAVALSALAGSALADPQSMSSGMPHDARARTPRETLDDRIAHLHAALKITPGEEDAWRKVAETMRWNEAAMQRLVAVHRAAPASSRTALNDLKAYEAFTRAHVEGLKGLITSFEALYVAMPPAQKAVADHVFLRFGREGFSSRS